ncbi:MAG: hypothetical protein M1444_02035, partial [Patescibacteria group bacterium]|nr:hypothetical protein [Patescibacteria group bacterium]
NSFPIQATMSGLSKNTIYRLRMVLAQMGTANYFGSTYNGTDWYNGAPSPIDYSKFLSITTDQNGAWYGEILSKFTGNDPNYTNVGSGNYDLKIGRYTENGSTATWSNIVQVSLIAPTPIPTPTPTQNQTPVSTMSPTSTPTPTKSSTPIPKLSTPAPSVLPTKVSLSENVLGEASESASVSSLEKPLALKNPKKEKIISSAKEDNIGKILIILGFVFILACGILFSWPYIREKLRKDEWQ